MPTILPRSAEPLADFVPTLSPLEAAAAVDAQHAIVVVVKPAEARHRRRFYYSLNAAEKAVGRARERSQDARIVLVRLEPVGVIADV